MKLNDGLGYPYFITYGVHMLRKQAVFRASIHEIFGWANSCTEAVLITDGLHDNLISFASHVYDPYSIDRQ